MGVSFTEQRIVEIPLASPDNADPNDLSAAQLDGKTFALGDHNQHGRPIEGHLLVFIVKDAAAGAGAHVAGATVSYTTWIEDSKTGHWYSLQADVANTRRLEVTKDVRGAKMFVQVTAASAGVSIIIRRAEI